MRLAVKKNTVLSLFNLSEIAVPSDLHQNCMSSEKSFYNCFECSAARHTTGKSSSTRDQGCVFGAEDLHETPFLGIPDGQLNIWNDCVGSLYQNYAEMYDRTGSRRCPMN